MYSSSYSYPRHCMDSG